MHKTYKKVTMTLVAILCSFALQASSVQTVHAQVATNSAKTATQSATATGSATATQSATATKSATATTSTLPKTLPQSGSTDAVVLFFVGMIFVTAAVTLLSYNSDIAEIANITDATNE